MVAQSVWPLIRNPCKPILGIWKLPRFKTAYLKTSVSTLAYLGEIGAHWVLLGSSGLEGSPSKEAPIGPVVSREVSRQGREREGEYIAGLNKAC